MKESTTIKNRRHGNVIEIYAPDLGIVRYSLEGEFITFLEPKI